MIFILLLIIFSIIFSTVRDEGIGLGIIGGIMVSLFLSMLMIVTVDRISDKYYIFEGEENITCLNDTTKIQGGYFLFSTNIDQKDVYKMYVTKKDNSKKLLTIKEKDCIGIYEEDTTPRIEKYQEDYKNPIVKFMFGMPLSRFYGVEYYKIYIPKNSITTEYNIDLK